MEFLSGEKLGDAVRDLCRGGRERRLAVAFWGHDAAKSLGLTDRGSPARILCDLRSGACDPTEIAALLKAGHEVRARDRLHAKVYLARGEAVVTSSNASANGLGNEGAELSAHSNLEAGVRVVEPDVLANIGEWLEGVWSDTASVKISENSEIMNEARELWKLRGSRRADWLTTREVGVKEAYKSNPRIFLDRNFVVTLTSTYGEKKSIEKAKEYCDKTGSPYTDGGYTDGSDDGVYIDGGKSNWDLSGDTIERYYKPGSRAIEIWTKKQADWADKKPRVSGFFHFRDPPETIPAKYSKRTKEVILLSTFESAPVLTGATRVRLNNDEDDAVLIKGMRIIREERKRAGTLNEEEPEVVDLTDVLKRGLEG